MPEYDAVDLRFSADGDLVVSEGGQLTDTAVFPLHSLRQEVITRLLANVGDWEVHPWMGTNAQQFIGEPLDEDTIEALVGSIRQGLTNDGLIRQDDLEIITAEWDQTTLAIVISIDVGQLDPDGEGRLEIPFAFDFNDLGVISFND